MEDFPEKALRHITEYLRAPSQVLLAVALSAPSSSWLRCGADRMPSRASKAVMPGCNIDLDTGAVLPYYTPAHWPVIDFDLFNREEYWPTNKLTNLTTRFDDGDVCGILVCCGARRDLKVLKLDRCTGITGEGLAPLIGAGVLEYIDLSKTCLCPSPMISERAVNNILQSIIDQGMMVLSRLMLPDTWKEGHSKLVGPFLEKYNRDMNNRNMACSKCDAICVGTDQRQWAVQRYDHYQLHSLACYWCDKCFCSKCDSQSLRYCPACKRSVCLECVDFWECEDECGQGKCHQCQLLSECSSCHKDTCDDCNTGCACCMDSYCSHCNGEQIVECAECGKGAVSNCTSCVDKRDHRALKQCFCCGDAFCRRCRPVEYCATSSSNVCVTCHGTLHDVIECHWKLVPPKVKQVIDGFASFKMSEDIAMEIWRESILQYPPDKQMDFASYRRNELSRAASHIIAAHFVCAGQERSAVHTI